MSEIEWKDGASGFLETDRGRIEFACHGPAPDNAPTVVMLHEGLGSVSAWKDFPQAVAEQTGLGVFVYSRFGYGRSSTVTLPRPIDYQSQEAKEVLPLVLDRIGFRSGILLGHSDGATMAAIYAGSFQDHRVRGLILLAPHFFCEDISVEGIAAAKQAYEGGDLKSGLARHHDDPDTAFYGWNDTWLDPEFRNWNVSEVIDYLRIPVLAIQGRDDQYGTLAQIDEIEQRIYSPVDTVILDKCGHWPHREKREETLSAITEFSERLLRIEREQVAVA
jgi:pimeloyl-ACP methyl ester carboxylesterase